MTNAQLSASPRDGTTKAKHLRKQAALPAVVYGRGLESRPISLEPKAFGVVFAEAGESSLIDLNIEGSQPVTVLVKDVQYDLLTRLPVHVDLQQVRMDEAITAEVKLELVGESPAVKGLGAILVESLHGLKVECLPGELKSEIEVDISVLTEFGQTIHIKDLNIPASWKLIGHDLEDVVVGLVEHKEEKVEEAAPVTPVEGEVPAEATAAAGEGAETPAEEKAK